MSVDSENAKELPLTARQIILAMRVCMARCGDDDPRVMVAADPRGVGPGKIMGIPIRRVTFDRARHDLVIVPHVSVTPTAGLRGGSTVSELDAVLDDVRNKSRIAELEAENRQLRGRLGEQP